MLWLHVIFRKMWLSCSWNNLDGSCAKYEQLVIIINFVECSVHDEDVLCVVTKTKKNCTWKSENCAAEQQTEKLHVKEFAMNMCVRECAHALACDTFFVVLNECICVRAVSVPQHVGL